MGEIAMRVKPVEGDVIDGFTVDGLLHAGGNGYVYRVTPDAARDPGFPLLMKVPGVGRGEPTLGVVSFEIEESILPQIEGPHVPRVVAMGNDPLRPWLVMEEIRGEGLAAIMERAPLAPADAVKVGAAIADALHSIHRQHVVHHDLKPENCILRADGNANGEAVLIDFGFARHAKLPDLLGEEEIFAAGSAPYVSPEQLRGVRGDPRSDVFALGVLLYQLVTGELPFGDPATYGGMRDRLWRMPVPPRSLVPALTPAMQEVILRCLEIDPERRPPSAAHVAFDLRNPSLVPLTARSEWTSNAGFARQMRSWWRARKKGARPVHSDPSVAAPVILIAVDTEHPEDDRHPALQRAARMLLSMYGEYRLIVVSAVRAAPLGEGAHLEETASGKHLAHRNRLRAWIAPLGLPPARISLHVVESNDPGATILGIANANHVDLIVLGAPSPGDRRLAWWRSVASEVTAGASCSVHVVRVTAREEQDGPPLA
ncbi:MAG: bifunctional serine/threonine-protein kinase/universal stress protein [Burkholderiales bacterium]